MTVLMNLTAHSGILVLFGNVSLALAVEQMAGVSNEFQYLLGEIRAATENTPNRSWRYK